jgi:TolB protein
MDADGNNPKRLTFAGSFNAAPSWSPDGKTIAFAGWAEKAFDIFTIDAMGSNLKRITKANKANGRQASHENPDFSPDGRVIIYTSNRTGNTQLFMSLADGSEEWRITQDSWSYFQPKWSP